MTLAEAMTKAGRKPEHLGADPQSGRPRRRLRRTARRAGPRAGSGRPADRRRFGHLAARAMAVHVLRRGEPRRHHPAGRPARPDAGVRILGARGAVAGRRPRRGRDVRQGHRRAQRRQRDSVGGARVARCPRRRRGDAAVAGRQDHRGSAAARRGRRHRTRGDRRVGHADRRVSRGPAGPAATGAGRTSATSRCCRPRPATTQASCPPVVPDRNVVRTQPDRRVAFPRRSSRRSATATRERWRWPTSWRTGWHRDRHVVV